MLGHSDANARLNRLALFATPRRIWSRPVSAATLGTQQGEDHQGDHCGHHEGAAHGRLYPDQKRPQDEADHGQEKHRTAVTAERMFQTGSAHRCSPIPLVTGLRRPGRSRSHMLRNSTCLCRGIRHRGVAMLTLGRFRRPRPGGRRHCCPTPRWQPDRRVAFAGISDRFSRSLQGDKVRGNSGKFLRLSLRVSRPRPEPASGRGSPGQSRWPAARAPRGIPRPACR